MDWYLAQAPRQVGLVVRKANDRLDEPASFGYANESSRIRLGPTAGRNVVWRLRIGFPGEGVLTMIYERVSEERGSQEEPFWKRVGREAFDRGTGLCILALQRDVLKGAFKVLCMKSHPGRHSLPKHRARFPRRGTQVRRRGTSVRDGVLTARRVLKMPGTSNYFVGGGADEQRPSSGQAGRRLLRPMMIYVFHGEDEFSLQEELAALKAGLDDDGMLINNTSRLEGGKLQPAEILGPCSTIPFMGSHRLVIVEGLLERFEGSRGKEKKTRERHTLEDPARGLAGAARHHNPRLRRRKDRPRQLPPAPALPSGGGARVPARYGRERCRTG